MSGEGTNGQGKGGGFGEKGAAELLAKQTLCAACGGAGGMKCECMQVYYCGKECQRAHWPTHKSKCAGQEAEESKAGARER